MRALALDSWLNASAERVVALPKASAWVTACAGVELVASEKSATLPASRSEEHTSELQSP